MAVSSQSIFSDIRGDKVIWLIVAILGVFGILAVYSAVGSLAYRNRGGDTEFYLLQQIVFISLGLGVTYVCYLLHYMQYSKIAPLLMLIVIPILLYTIGFGAEINSAKRWIQIPWIDKTIQSSDFARLALIIFVSRSLSIRQEQIKDLKGAFIPVIIPIILICALIAPADLSTASLLFLTCMLMMYIGRVSLKYIGLLILLGLVVFSILIILGKFFPEFIRVETWVNRIEHFIYEPNGGYQNQQAKIAVANGGLFGVGPGNSMQRNYLPLAYADFIYAIICEEYGIVGGVVVLFLYLLLLVRCMKIVTKCPKTFGAILAMGLCLNLVIQALANMAVTVHLLPVTGLTLPLVSMGGTSILFTCMSLGIILSVSKYVEEAELKKMKLQQIEARDADSI